MRTRTMRARAKRRAEIPWALAVAVAALALGCSDVPTSVEAPSVDAQTIDPQAAKPICPGHPSCGNDGDDGGSTGSPTAVISTSIAGSGVYGDTHGAYVVAFNSDGDLWVGNDAFCDDGRYIELDVKGQAGVPFTDPVQTCKNKRGKSSASPRIAVPLLLGAQEGDVLGAPMDPSSSNFGDATNYYFFEGGSTYNVVWQGGIEVVQVDQTATETVYHLSTITAAADGFGQLSDLAELWRAETSGQNVLAPDLIAHLELVVTVPD